MGIEIYRLILKGADINMKSFLTLKSFFKEHKWSYALGVFWLILIDMVQLTIPLILGALADEFDNNIITSSSIIKYASLIVATGLITALGRYFWRMYIIGTSRQLEYFLRKRIFNHLLTLSPNYFNTHKTGDLMAHSINDINAVRMAAGPGTVMIVDSTFMMFFSLVMMIRTTSFRFTAITMFTLPFIIVFVTMFGRIIHKRFRIVQEAFSNLSDNIQESFSGIRVVKSFVQEDLEFQNFTDINEDNLEKNLDLVKISGLFRPFVQFLSSISFLLVILYGGREVILNRISLGDFVTFNSYLGLIVWPMMALGQVINVLQRGAASLDRINTILDEKPEIVDDENPIELKDPSGKVEFKDVSFKYQNTDEYAIKDINFTIEGGKSLALVGRTGSGKSTIVNLILRLYDIEEGEIKFDGIDIKKLSLKSLRENIGYVPQDNFLFSTSLEENIGFSFEGTPDKEKVIEASKLAQVYDNIIEFPKGFDTVLGERGVTLSGGQQQRTAIARALIKKPPLLILDDSLSSVDTETEEMILGNMDEIMEKSTTIIISHRISTIKDCDEIIFLEDGEIIERGTHEELLSLNGLYKDLHEKQLLEEKIVNY